MHILKIKTYLPYRLAVMLVGCFFHYLPLLLLITIGFLYFYILKERFIDYIGRSININLPGKSTISGPC